MKDWKQVLMGLCKVKSILTFYFGYQSAKAEDKGGVQ